MGRLCRRLRLKKCCRVSIGEEDTKYGMVPARIVTNLDSLLFTAVIPDWKINSDWETRHADHTSPLNWPVPPLSKDRWM